MINILVNLPLITIFFIINVYYKKVKSLFYLILPASKGRLAFPTCSAVETIEKMYQLRAWWADPVNVLRGNMNAV